MTQHITGYYTFGGGTLDGEALENALKADAPLHVNTVQYASSGGGMSLSRERGLVANVAIDTIVDQDAGHPYDTTVGMGYGLFNIGWAWQLGPLRIVPLIGVGGGGIGVDLSPLAAGNPPDAPDLRLNRTNFLLHLGVIVELRIGGRFGMSVGGATGYVFAPFSNREGIRGPYLRGFFGGRLRVP
jgi:hypothetical protein